MTDIFAILEKGGSAAAAVAITICFLRYMGNRDKAIGEALKAFASALKAQTEVLAQLRIAVGEICEIARKCTRK